MSKGLLLDTRNDKYYVGNTYEELARATGRVTFDVAKRTVLIDGKKILTFTLDWSPEEFLGEASGDTVEMLVKNYGFVVYHNADRN